MKVTDTSRPVLLLGGSASTLAATRSFGEAGVPVIVSGSQGCRALHSRYCSQAIRIPEGQDSHTFWKRILIEDPMPELAGAVIFVGCDDSLQFIEEHADALRQRYLVEEFKPELRRAMLDKLETLVLAREAGIPTPQFWRVSSTDEVAAISEELRFPVMVKPLDSHAFLKAFGRKLFIVEDSIEEVAEKVAFCIEHGHDIMIVEMIPGPDSLLSSYYTYRKPDGGKLYDYTKSVIRRWPVNRGGGCFHQSEWLPETAELGWELFDGVEWQGIGNVEFKCDPRDGQLKIIEVNSRLTAGHPLLTQGGAAIDLIVYCHLTGQELPSFDSYAQSLRLWDPLRDFMAFLQLRKRGELGLLGWIRSLFAQRMILPFFRLDDPGPSISELFSTFRRIVRSAVLPDQKARQNAD